MTELCALFGYSRQAYYEAFHQSQKTSIAQIIILTEVSRLRADIPYIGIRKLIYLLDPI